MNRTQESDAAHSLRYGCSVKADGTMLVAHDGQIYLPGQRHREKFFKDNNISHWAVCRLAHSTDIRVVTLADDQTVIYDTDGLLTSDHGLFLCLTVADCFPVYFWSKPRTAGVVGLAHAGWRGASNNIVGQMVEKIKLEFSCSPEDLMTAIGPGIRQCHFEVKEDVLQKFVVYPEFAARRDGKTFFDLAGVIKKQLLGAGILADNITDIGECTYCLSDRYFSYRRDKTSPINTMLAYIGLEN